MLKPEPCACNRTFCIIYATKNVCHIYLVWITVAGLAYENTALVAFDRTCYIGMSDILFIMHKSYKEYNKRRQRTYRSRSIN